jgi:hypothetical protein
MEHVYHNTETGKMIMIALQSLQMEAGILAHLLTNPTPLLVYTEPCWILAPRAFMAKNQLSLAAIHKQLEFLACTRQQHLPDVYFLFQQSLVQFRYAGS